MHEVKLPDAPDRAKAAELPDYLERTYWWAYLWPASIRIFDRDAMVSAILWGQYRHLCDMALEGILPGSRVLQMACVYGDLSPRLGCKGQLDIVDIAPIQVQHARTKLGAMPWARSYVADAAEPGPDRYDSVLVFFLLHELPDVCKHQVVDAALAQLRPGGKAIFIDYARPAAMHPLKPVMAGVFALLEPFAKTMWHTGIRSLATQTGQYKWTRSSVFGGLYQKVTATRPYEAGDLMPELRILQAAELSGSDRTVPSARPWKAFPGLCFFAAQQRAPVIK